MFRFRDKARLPATHREGLILPLVLLVIALLALLGSSFAWMARADYQAAHAGAERITARLTADAGVQHALVLLRTRMDEFEAWWNNEEELGQRIVSLPGEPSDFTGENRTADELDEGERAWLYSLVADDPLDDEPYSIRYGITDEASKLNLNVISGEMMLELILRTVPHVEELDLPGMVDAFLDWRDDGDEVRPNGAEESYYESLRPPYGPRNGRFRTVEELLMVRGFTSQVLYGEDHNRNGILDLNEDDGEVSYPDDNADGELNRGIYPYLTVYSKEVDAGPQQGQPGGKQGGQQPDPADQGPTKPDINTATLETLAQVASPEVAAYIIAAQATGVSFNSSEELLEGPAVFVPDSLEKLPNPVTDGDLDALENVFRFGQSSGAPGEQEGEEEPDLGLPKPAPDSLWGQQMIEGRVNINTAPAPVLGALGVFAEEEIGTIIAARAELDDEQRKNVNWLTSTGAVSQESFAAAAPYLTAKAEQFTIESVGYANHLGVICRLQVVVEVLGQSVPRIIYFRDISSLGSGYPVRQLLRDREERESAFGRTRQRT